MIMQKSDNVGNANAQDNIVDTNGDGVADVYGTPTEFPVSGYLPKAINCRGTIGDTAVLKFEVNGEQVLSTYDADGKDGQKFHGLMDPTLWDLYMRIEKKYATNRRFHWLAVQTHYFSI